MLTWSLPPSTNKAWVLPLDSTRKSRSAEPSLNVVSVVSKPILFICEPPISVDIAKLPVSAPSVTTAVKAENVTGTISWLLLFLALNSIRPISSPLAGEDEFLYKTKSGAGSPASASVEVITKLSSALVLEKTAVPETFNTPPKSEDVPMLTWSLPPSTNSIFALPLDSTRKSRSAEPSLNTVPVPPWNFKNSTLEPPLNISNWKLAVSEPSATFDAWDVIWT